MRSRASSSLDVFARSITFKVEAGLFSRDSVFLERNRTMSIFGLAPDFDFSLSSPLARNWTVVVARGVLGLVIGFIPFLFTGPTLLSLVGLFAVFLIIDGILAIVAAVRAASKNERWGVLTFEGIAGIVAGISHGLAWPHGVRLWWSPRGLGPSFGGAGASRGLQSRHGPWPLVAGPGRDHFDCFRNRAGRSAGVRRLGGDLVGRRLCDVFRGNPSRARLPVACAKHRARNAGDSQPGLTRKGMLERTREPGRAPTARASRAFWSFEKRIALLHRLDLASHKPDGILRKPGEAKRTAFIVAGRA